MRFLAGGLFLGGLLACSTGSPEPCAECTNPAPAPSPGPFVNESSTAVFLGSAAPPPGLALESLTLSENAELLVPEVFGATLIADRIPPGGVIALAIGSLTIAATSTAKASTRYATLVSFVANGTEGRALLVGTPDAIGRAAVRDVGGELAIVALDNGVTVYPIRPNTKPPCSDGETKKTLDWSDRIGTATIATQTWTDGCVDVTFAGETPPTQPFHACLPRDAWPFEENRAVTFTPFANREGLAHTNGLGERGLAISDGRTTLELAVVKAPLSWAAPIAGGAELAVAATKHCVTVSPECTRITTPIAVTFIEQGTKRAIDLGAPFEREVDGKLLTHRVVGGRVTPVRSMTCEGDSSGYSMELVTLRRPK